MPSEHFNEILSRIRAHDASLPDDLNLYQTGMRQDEINTLFEAINEFPEYKARLTKIVLDSDPFSGDEAAKNRFISIYLEGFASLISISIRSTDTRDLEIRECPNIKYVYLVGNPYLYKLPDGKIHGVTKVETPNLTWGRSFINPAFEAPLEAPVIETTAPTVAASIVTLAKELDKIVEESDSDADDWFPAALLWDKMCDTPHRDSPNKERAYTATTADSTLTSVSEPPTPSSPSSSASQRPRTITAGTVIGERPRVILG